MGGQEDGMLPPTAVHIDETSEIPYISELGINDVGVGGLGPVYARDEMRLREADGRRLEAPCDQIHCQFRCENDLEWEARLAKGCMDTCTQNFDNCVAVEVEKIRIAEAEAAALAALQAQ